MNRPRGRRLTAFCRSAHAPPTMDIRMIKDVLRLKLHGKLSHEAVACSLSISKGVVAKYVTLATASGLMSWEAIAALRASDR